MSLDFRHYIYTSMRLLAALWWLTAETTTWSQWLCVDVRTRQPQSDGKNPERVRAGTSKELDNQLK